MRKKVNYPDCKDKNSYESGLEFQDYVCRLLLGEGILLQNFCSKKYQFEEGENIQGFEIKLDRRCIETGRLSIEISEKTNKNQQNWTPSGIYRNDNTWIYIQGNYDCVWIFSIKNLRLLHDLLGEDNEHELPTIRKFYLSLKVADKHCLKKIERRNNTKNSNGDKNLE